MKVAELITLLQSLPGEHEVLLNWEGELVHTKECRIVQVHQYMDSANMSEDYFPEIVDEEYKKWEAVLID